MFSKVHSAAMVGMKGFIINVEADVSDGLPLFELVGFLGSEVKEARERVRIGLKNSGFSLLPKRITVNLSPADIRKEGTIFDLAIAISVLSSFGLINKEGLERTLIIGELSLNGDIKPINGVLPIVHFAKSEGFIRCIVPAENKMEAAAVSGIEVYPVSTLKEAVLLFNNQMKPSPFSYAYEKYFKEELCYDYDFSDVAGQSMARRGIEVAASGMHHLLMVGSPGSGKTMMAKRIPTIIPKLTIEESLEISKLYSIAGLLKNSHSIIQTRPFRSPHHTITLHGLTGGGRIPMPGEISLAHLGVLFLDELPEFSRSTIEILRQPLEENRITISRVHGTYTYPANFMLAAALNPCPCGFYPDRNKCNCSINSVRKYLGKISGPIFDRIDICVETMELKLRDLNSKRAEESSETIRKRVEVARQIQLERYRGQGIFYNSQLTHKQVEVYCTLREKERTLLDAAFTRLSLSVRAYHKVLKVARTIADLDGKAEIESSHLSEAISYRGLDRKFFKEG